MECVDRLNACIESLCNASTPVEAHTKRRNLLKQLFRVKQVVIARKSGNNQVRSPGTLFNSLLQALVIYGGGQLPILSNSSSNTASSGGSKEPTMSASNGSSSGSLLTSEYIQNLICECLVKTYDYGVTSSVNDTLTSKTMPLFVKVTLMIVLSKLPFNDAKQFLPEIISFTSKNMGKSTDYYSKQCLLESVTRLLQNDSVRLLVFHGEAFKIVNKSFQDESPEVRIASAGLLHVIAQYSSGNNTNNTHGASSSSNSNQGVSLEAIMQVASKSMDDEAPEVRRAFSVVMGVVLARYSLAGSPLVPGSEHGVPIHQSNFIEDDDAAAANGSTDSHTKSKLAFKLPNVNLGALARKKPTTVSFSTTASVISYLKDTICTKFLPVSKNPGGILAAFSISLNSMFENLPSDSFADNQLGDIVEAVVSILDYPFVFGDYARARNAVCFVLRYGIAAKLADRKREALFGIYLTKLKEELSGNHHKLLTILVECSHLLQSYGESSIVHAKDLHQILQNMLSHEKQSVRFQAAVALASLVVALPYYLNTVMHTCLSELKQTTASLLQSSNEENSKASLYVVQGKSAAISHILRAICLQQQAKMSTHSTGIGCCHATLAEILNLGEILVESQFSTTCADSIWLTCTRAGWNLIGSVVVVPESQWIQSHAVSRLMDLFVKSSELHTRESSLELLRMEACVTAMHSFLAFCLEEESEEDDCLHKNHTAVILAQVLQVYIKATQEQFLNPAKRRGQVARYRLITWIMKCFTLIPTKIYRDSYVLLLDLIAEYSTAQSLTNLRHSSLVPASSTYLHNALCEMDDPLEMATPSRLINGDLPSALYSRELNHILSLVQHEHALTEIEVEIQYLDTFWSSFCGNLDFLHSNNSATSNTNTINNSSSSKRKKKRIFSWIQDPISRRGSCSSFTYVRLVDASVFLFGRLFHFIGEELQLRGLQHLAGVLADGKVDCEVNVCSLLFAALREAGYEQHCSNLQMASPRSASSSVESSSSEASSSNSNSSWASQIQGMLLEMIASIYPKVQRAAGEGLGILSSLSFNEANIKQISHEVEKRLAIASSAITSSATVGITSGSPTMAGSIDSHVLSAGACFAYACIKRACGSRVAIDTALVFKFGGEISQPLRTWMLHSWSVIIECVGSGYVNADYFEQYLKSTLSLMDTHLLGGFRYSRTNKRGIRWQIGAKVAIGRIIIGVLSTLGPEVACNLDRMEDLNLTWDLLRQDGTGNTLDARVELEFLKYLEQVVVLAPSAFRPRDLEYILSILSDISFISEDGAIIDLEKSIGTGLFPLSGTCRNLLQRVGMSCLRTLVEREPTLIHRQRLQCLLFHALHVEFQHLQWQYLPGLHGMWDFLSFKSESSHQANTRKPIDEIRHTIMTLIDVERNGKTGGSSVWVLFCRSLAIGESSASSASSTSQDNTTSPKHHMITDDRASTTTENTTVGATAASGGKDEGAAVAQMETWRMTKVQVADLIKHVPVLMCRQVRLFAIECVINIFQQLARSGDERHFDLVKARQHYLNEQQQNITGSSDNNFLCLYVDELVTLACQISTASSSSGLELQHFQCAGLKLLNLVLKYFAHAIDPEVASGDAKLLDTYQAQMTSAMRNALKQQQQNSSSSDSTQASSSTETPNQSEQPLAAIVNDRFDGHGPLLIEAYQMVGITLESFFLHDKVALGRILKMVQKDNYLFQQEVEAQQTVCTQLFLANLECLARVYTLVSQQEQKDPKGILKSVMDILQPSFDQLVNCWKQSLIDYGQLMQRYVPGWPTTPSNNTFDIEKHHESDELEQIYSQYIPFILQALVYSSSRATSGDVLPFVLATSLFSLSSIESVLTLEQEQNFVLPIVQVLPSLCEKMNGPVEYDQILQTLRATSLKVQGPVRIETLKALQLILRLRKDAGALTPAVVSAALTALEVFEKSYTRAKAGVRFRAQTSRVKLLTGEEPLSELMDLLCFASTGIIFVHTIEGDITAKKTLQNAVQSLEGTCRFLYKRKELQDALFMLSRAIMESFVVYSISDTPLIEDNKQKLQQVLVLMIQWVREEIAGSNTTSLEFVLRLVSNLIVSSSSSMTSLTSVYGAFHHVLSTILTREIQEPNGQSPQKRIAVLEGLHGICKKLGDVNDPNLGRYCTAIGSCLVEVVISGKQKQKDEVAVVDTAENLLRLICTQMDETFGAAFVRAILPSISTALLSNNADTDPVSTTLSSILARLLLSFAQTRATAFKEVVVAMPVESRSVLETTLRQALTGGGGSHATSTTTPGQLQSMGSQKLDLSRYA